MHTFFIIYCKRLCYVQENCQFQQPSPEQKNARKNLVKHFWLLAKTVTYERRKSRSDKTVTESGLCFNDSVPAQRTTKRRVVKYVRLNFLLATIFLV